MVSTVFVVGAGASVEFGLPTGAGLNKMVAGYLAPTADKWGSVWNDHTLDQALKNWPGIHPNRLLAASRKIAAGIPFASSVDDFLFIHGDDEAVVAAGKAAIAASVLYAENKSYLARLGHHDDTVQAKALGALETSWPLQLMKFLMPGIRAKDVGELFSDVAFVNFNYDRCLEHALYHGLQRTHALSPEEAGDVVKSVAIVHPYGRAGYLSWEKQHPKVPFGGAHDGRTIIELASEVHTLTESHHTDDERQQIRALLTGAERIVFLGFGFHRQNIDLISPIQSAHEVTRPQIFATAYGTSLSDQRIFARLINGAFAPDKQPVFADLDCQTMLSNFGRELTF